MEEKKAKGEKGKRESKKQRQKRFLEALENSLGIVLNASKKTGISRNTHYTWLEEPEYRKEVDSIQEAAIDYVESSLFTQIKQGVPSSTIFYLKTKAKHRGYVERTEHEISGVPDIVIETAGHKFSLHGPVDQGEGTD